ncbi:glycosyltransferase family A protein [Geodermatophilus sp. SYSU D00697]
MKVSVLVLPHAPPVNLSEALQSAVMQQTDDDFEIVTGDDGLGALAVDVLSGYRNRYSFQIVPLRPASPGTRSESVVLWDLVKASRGQYVALLHGSDLWVSDAKLRTQSRFLDEHQDCSASFHAVTTLSDGSPDAGAPSIVPETGVVTAEDLLGTRTRVPPSSMMWRRSALPCLPAWVHELRSSDRAVASLIARHGDIGYLPEIMAAARTPRGQDTASRVEELADQLELHRRLNDVLPLSSYEQLVYARAKVRALLAVERCIPAGATVAVVTEGDDELLDLGPREARHLMLADGTYAGHHPADADAAVEALEEARSRGARYLLIPANAFWWFSRYRDWGRYLVTRHRRLWADDEALIFELTGEGDPPCG